jgi:hypothetical protein
MTDETKQRDQFGENADATSGGGASAERGGRDAGMPGPAPGSATRGSKRYADTTESDAAGTGATGSAPVHSAADQPAAGRPATGSAPKPTV